jgi:hypothetical protein
MFQQSIPRLLSDSDIATYKGQFILIDKKVAQFYQRLYTVINIFIKRQFWKGYKITENLQQE